MSDFYGTAPEGNRIEFHESVGWLTPFDGDGIEWHESLPSPYTYQESDFGKLVTAVHQYEARVQELRKALRDCAIAANNGKLAHNQRRRGAVEKLDYIYKRASDAFARTEADG